MYVPIHVQKNFEKDIDLNSIGKETSFAFTCISLSLQPRAQYCYTRGAFVSEAMSRHGFTRGQWIALFLEHETPRTECTFWFIFIIITAAVSARAVCVRCVHSRRLPRHPVSCLSRFRYSRVRARNPEIQHVTGKRSATLRVHPERHVVAEALGSLSWKKLLRIISTRLWFSSISLKYLRIYSTFHEYPKEPKATPPYVVELPFTRDRYRWFSRDPNFLKKNNITANGVRYSLSYFLGFKREDVIRRCNTKRRDREKDFFFLLSFRFTINSRKLVTTSSSQDFLVSFSLKRKYLVFCE